MLKPLKIFSKTAFDEAELMTNTRLIVAAVAAFVLIAGGVALWMQNTLSERVASRARGQSTVAPVASTPAAPEAKALQVTSESERVSTTAPAPEAQVQMTPL